MVNNLSVAAKANVDFQIFYGPKYGTQNNGFYILVPMYRDANKKLSILTVQ